MKPPLSLLRPKSPESVDQMSRRRWISLGAGAAMLAALAAWILGGSGNGADRAPSGVNARSERAGLSRSEPSDSEPVEPGESAVAEPAWLAGVPAASRGPLPASLRGSEIDGFLEVDADGDFLPSPGVRRLFDYFLSAAGEESAAVMRGRILLHLHENLPPRAAAQAARLLDDFLALRRAARELARADSVPRDLERRWQWIRELRREYLGARNAEALYGEEEYVTMLDMQRRDVLRDETLDDEGRAERLEAIEARLPDHVRRSRRAASAPARVRTEVAALRSAGASEDEIFALRASEFGEEAARRLAELDRRRAEDAQRLAEYRRQRDAILTDPSLDSGERAAAVEALRADTFEPHELARIRALDRAEPIDR